MSTVRLRLVDTDYNAFDLVPSRPLHVARVLVDTTHILPNLRFNRSEQEVVDGIEGVGEDQLGPRKNTKFVAG